MFRIYRKAERKSIFRLQESSLNGLLAAVKTRDDAFAALMPE